MTPKRGVVSAMRIVLLCTAQSGPLAIAWASALLLSAHLGKGPLGPTWPFLSGASSASSSTSSLLSAGYFTLLFLRAEQMYLKVRDSWEELLLG